jgi:endonuclease/exonuclease/phosphatase family metal-dependent hydrolase
LVYGSASRKMLAPPMIDVSFAPRAAPASSLRNSASRTLRLDHIFVSREMFVDAVHRPTGTDFQMASDHLPLVADLVIPRSGKAREGSAS